MKNNKLVVAERRFLFPPMLSALLIVSMALPPHYAYGLRPTGLEESPNTRADLINRLREGNATLLSLTNDATGMEEGEIDESKIMRFVEDLKAAENFSTIISPNDEQVLARMSKVNIVSHGFARQGARKIISSMLMGVIKPMSDHAMLSMGFEQNQESDGYYYSDSSTVFYGPLDLENPYGPDYAILDPSLSTDDSLDPIGDEQVTHIPFRYILFYLVSTPEEKEFIRGALKEAKQQGLISEARRRGLVKKVFSYADIVKLSDNQLQALSAGQEESFPVEGTKTISLDPTGISTITIGKTELERLESPIDIIWGGGSVALRIIPIQDSRGTFQIVLGVRTTNGMAASEPYSLTPGSTLATGRSLSDQSYTGMIVSGDQVDQLSGIMNVTRLIDNKNGELTIWLISGASSTLVRYQIGPVSDETMPATSIPTRNKVQEIFANSRNPDGSLNILCLCSGNLWRSAALHMTLEHAIAQQGFSNVTVQSGGTLLWGDGGVFGQSNIAQGIATVLGTQILNLPQAQKLILAIATENPDLLDQEGPLSPDQILSEERLWQFYQHFDPTLWLGRIEQSSRLKTDNARKNFYKSLLTHLITTMDRFDQAIEQRGSEILAESLGRNVLLEQRARQQGIDNEIIGRFFSKPVTRKMVMDADVIIVADEINNRYLAELFPGSTSKTMLFTELVPDAFPDARDMPDPQGAMDSARRETVLEIMFSAVQSGVSNTIVPLLSTKPRPTAGGQEEQALVEKAIAADQLGEFVTQTDGTSVAVVEVDIQSRVPRIYIHTDLIRPNIPDVEHRVFPLENDLAEVSWRWTNGEGSPNDIIILNNQVPGVDSSPGSWLPQITPQPASARMSPDVSQGLFSGETAQVENNLRAIKKLSLETRTMLNMDISSITFVTLGAATYAVITSA